MEFLQCFQFLLKRGSWRAIPAYLQNTVCFFWTDTKENPINLQWSKISKIRKKCQIDLSLQIFTLFQMVCYEMVLPSHNTKLSQCFLRKLPNLKVKFLSNHHWLVPMILILIQKLAKNLNCLFTPLWVRNKKFSIIIIFCVKKCVFFCAFLG